MYVPCLASPHTTLAQEETESAGVKMAGGAFYFRLRWSKKKLRVYFQKCTNYPPPLTTVYDEIISLANSWHDAATKKGVLVPKFKQAKNKKDSDIRTLLTG